MQTLLLNSDMEAVHLQRLEGVAGRYFRDRFPGSEVIFEIKETGVQLGTIARIREPEGQSHTFYMKTHSEGKLASKSSAAKIADPNELFVYKVLEGLGFGCEAHFCARSPEDVYIATRDAAEGGRFFLFKQAIEDGEGLGASLWGSLGRMSNSPRENNWGAIEDELAHDPIGQRFADQSVTVDVLARLLGLHDLLDNPENFGFFKSTESEFPTVRVIDFRLDVRSVELVDPIFGGLLSGNGTFKYAAAHKTLGGLLHERKRPQRVATALHILTLGKLHNLTEVVEGAYRSVCHFIQKTPEFDAHRAKFFHDLNEYRDAVQQNCLLLIDDLASNFVEERSKVRYVV